MGTWMHFDSVSYSNTWHFRGNVIFLTVFEVDDLILFNLSILIPC